VSAAVCPVSSARCAQAPVEALQRKPDKADPLSPAPLAVERMCCHADGAPEQRIVLRRR